jgi:hypothetical protein
VPGYFRLRASNGCWFIWSISSIWFVWLIRLEIHPEETDRPERPANQTDEPACVARAQEVPRSPSPQLLLLPSQEPTNPTPEQRQGDQNPYHLACRRSQRFHPADNPPSRRIASPRNRCVYKVLGLILLLPTNYGKENLTSRFRKRILADSPHNSKQNKEDQERHHADHAKPDGARERERNERRYRSAGSSLPLASKMSAHSRPSQQEQTNGYALPGRGSVRLPASFVPDTRMSRSL